MSQAETPSQGRKTRWRTWFNANTVIAAGTIASVIVATFAVVSAKHAENIATEQVNAAYFSNLYSKQVEAYASLFFQINDFRTQFIRSEDIIASDDTQNDPEMIRKILHERKPAYLQQVYQVMGKIISAKLVSPKELEKPLQDILDEVANMRSTIKNYADKDSPTATDLAKFKQDFEDQARTLKASYEQLTAFVHSILIGGRPLSEDTIRSCALSP